MSIPALRRQVRLYVSRSFTPSVWKILEALDSEKMDILEKLGFERVPYVEACKFRNSLDETRDAKEVFFWYAAMPTRAKGPTSVESRYITEDVPQGLVMLEALASRLGVSSPVCTVLRDSLAALGRDLRVEGRTVDRLGSQNIDKILEDTRERERKLVASM